jgi:hypothetical protein
MKTLDKQSDKNLNIEESSTLALQNECTLLKQEVEELNAKLKWYEEQFRLNKQKCFGASSEKTDSDQLSIFNEAEKESLCGAARCCLTVAIWVGIWFAYPGNAGNVCQ